MARTFENTLYIQPRIRGGVGSPIQLLSSEVLQNSFNYDITAYRAKQFRL